MGRKKTEKTGASVSPKHGSRVRNDTTVHSSPAASGQCSSPFAASVDEEVLMSPVKEAPAKMRTGNHRTALAGQVGSSRGAAARAPDAHGGRSARIPVLNEVQTPDIDQDFAFAKLSTGRHAAGAKRMLLSAIDESGA